MKAYAVLDVPRAGAENMAIDAAMLQAAAERDAMVLRIYQWARPTVSLGYFQKFDDLRSIPQLVQTDVVRRTTGGGAIVHHHDWTYSLALPHAALSKDSNKKSANGVGAALPLYDCVHNAVVAWLNSQKIDARKWTPGCATGQADSLPQARSAGLQAKGTSAPFLCFQRRSCGDVVVDQDKVLGSAQRRGAGAILQHGSLLLASSSRAPQLIGLQELSEVRTDWVNDLGGLLRERFFACLVDACATMISQEVAKLSQLELLELELSDSLRQFDSHSWTERV